MCHSIAIFHLKTNFFFNYSPKNFKKFFFLVWIFFDILQNFEKSIDHTCCQINGVCDNKIISNGGIPLILFLFSAISNRCIQKKGINKLIFHKDIYMEGESLTPSLLDKACADTTASHGKIAI